MAAPFAVSAAPPRSASHSAADEAMRFTVFVLLAALLLQRFAIPLGELPLSIVGPIGLLFGAYWLFRGALVLDHRRTAAFVAIAAIGCVGALNSLAGTTARFAEISWPSFAQFLLLSSFALLSFREPVDEARFFAAVNACFAFIGVAGILQFFAQFAGVSLFSFVELGVPIKYTLEFVFYNTKNPVGASGLIKSNGFFLNEASIYSQMAALGLAIELVYFRRLRYLVIFTMSLIVSVSGTGWMVFGVFVAGVVVNMGVRGIAIAVGALATGALALGALAFAQPEVFDYFVGRIEEFSSPGSSAHLRFITPFWALSDVSAEKPLALLVGAGAGTSERLQTQLAYAYNLNTPLKIALEYGLPGLVAYLMLFLRADRTPRQASLLAPAMYLFLFTGGYAQYPPVLFPILLLTSVARLEPSRSPTRAL